MERTVRSLQEACLGGDVAALHALLEKDKLVFDRATACSAVAADAPLHVAALLGHADLVRAIVRLKPELARKRDAHASYPLHLAAANGRRQVVEALLQADTGLCLLRDGDGHLPIHVAVLSGELDVTEALMVADSGSARALTSRGESVLHLAVTSNNFEIVRLVVENPNLGEDEEFLNLPDEGGNTVLHLAASRRQLQTLKLLTGKPGVDVNATNRRGATALDVLLELPRERGDLVVGDIMYAAGGRTTSSCGEIGSHMLPAGTRRGSSSNARGEAATGRRITQRRRTKRSFKKSDEHWISYAPGTLMVVAVLIATVTFQAGIQPPGGFWQDTEEAHARVANFTIGNGTEYSTWAVRGHFAGKATLSDHPAFILFMFFDFAALFLSMSIILLLLCVLPHKRRNLTAVLMWIMWIAVFCTAMAFIFGVFASSQIFTMGVYMMPWVAVLGITVLWVLARFIIYLLRKVFPKRDPQISGDQPVGGESSTNELGVRREILQTRETGI